MKGWLKMAVIVATLHGGATLSAQAYLWAPQEGGPKRVVIDKSRQVLRAYEGNHVVLESRVSTGRRGRETPSGYYRARSKSLMHYSRLYHNAPMPYSVQIAGNYFIHGFSSVPNFPASHGCIRLPVDNARELYNWIDHGTPVAIVGG